MYNVGYTKPHIKPDIADLLPIVSPKSTMILPQILPSLQHHQGPAKKSLKNFYRIFAFVQTFKTSFVAGSAT